MIDIEKRIKKMLDEQSSRNLNFNKDWERYKTKKVTIFERILPRAQKINNKIKNSLDSFLSYQLESEKG